MDLEKAFDLVPQKVIWWALKKQVLRNELCGKSRECTLMREAGFVLARISAKSLR